MHTHEHQLDQTVPEEMGHYVNSPDNERRNREEQRQNRHSGGSKFYRLVGVSFGLLCILQAALNVSFRLRAVGCSNNVTACNFTMMPAGDIEVLISERDQVVQERAQLIQERDQLLHEEKRLVQDNAKLLEDKGQLAKEIKNLLANNSHLIENKKILNEKVIEQQSQIKELEMQQKASRCPQGWWTYMSNCYQVSSMTNTWNSARQDCSRKGSHLVILNDEIEERIVRTFAGPVKIWMGLYGHRDRKWNSWTWTLEDRSSLLYANWNDWTSDFGKFWAYGCAYLNPDSSFLKNWFVDSCEEQYYWMCEKELHTSSIKPK